MTDWNAFDLDSYRDPTLALQPLWTPT